MGKPYAKIAIAYDFDGTLAKGNIQENSFIPDLGMKKDEFWQEVRKLSEENEMDEILAYMYLLIEKARTANVKIDRDSLKNHGKTVQYFDGVEDFFRRINDYGKSQCVNIEHYIISSGTKEMIEGTSIAKNFKYIYASSFMYDQHKIPTWPAMAINYTTKTQFLFRINKGIENSWDNSQINNYTPKEERPIPFNRIIYIGDGLTDVPAMKMVNYQGGTSIGVYDPSTRGSKGKVNQLLEEGRVSFFAPAKYTEYSEIDKIIKAKIDIFSAEESIVRFAKPIKIKGSQST